MKRFALSALVCTALACPGLADDPTDEVECTAAPDELAVRNLLYWVDTPNGDPPAVEPEITPAFDPDATDIVKDVELPEDCPVEVNAVLEDGPYIRTLGETERNNDVDPSILYFSASSSNTDSTSNTSSDAPSSVNQLADEQRNSLRLFSGREAAADKAARASNLKDLFAARAALKTEAAGHASTRLAASERDAARQKAEIDQLRDKALRTGDSRLMSQADAMAAAQGRANPKTRTFFGFSFGRK